ncbi:enamine deaminase RidA (YjgF/YER057c/UK114 family) [Xenorhabdus cabanillasii]|uniref:Enamine deaminase RidA (YjgF/YER057c/UK114 family) n=1 Tax=Xenorhabdus cabanillasii TaxID=351673 RepID=A0A3D9UAW4_9GAMM|nr:RidA family protein [Xenorhabdus cabanillasii]REF26406.1 enamine deaminase RidA (YjgF/YER057c/UK114 family) [Xenorhabdus cabanillasii]
MKLINPTEIHPPIGEYSHQALLGSNKSLLVISGQIGMYQDGSVPDDQSQQFSLALNNIRINIEAQKLNIQDIVKMTFYWSGEILEARKRNHILNTWLEGHRPCMTMMVVKALARSDLLIEVDALVIGVTHD